MSAPSAPGRGPAIPRRAGRFGPYGGRFVPETLMVALDQLADEYARGRAPTRRSRREFDDYLTHYVGRPSPLYFAERLTRQAGGADIYLKREDLNHTGAHKINNAIGQALLARRMGKTRVIAETGAGQHGVATATAGALFGLQCTVYMGEEDVRRQKLNVFHMRAMGAEVVPGHGRHADAPRRDQRGDARLDGHVEHTHYIIGSVVGPHPFPMMVRDFQAVIGREAREQCLERVGRLPDVVVACVGGGSQRGRHVLPVRRRRRRSSWSASRPAAAARRPASTPPRLTHGKPGVLHGSFSYVLQDDDGQTADVHSVSAGLDYPGVGPEHSYWKDTGRVRYVSITDDEALEAFDTTGEARRHPPRPGDGPRRRPGREGGPAARRRQGRRRLPLRPRRQGRLRGRPAARRADLTAGEPSPGGRHRPARSPQSAERRVRTRPAPTGNRMNRIDALFARLRSEGRRALMPFVTAGDPDLATTAALIAELVARGAHLVEVGFPYSDPIADGPVIAASYTGRSTAGSSSTRSSRCSGASAPRRPAARWPRPRS